jgi:DNA polymerase-1
MMRELAVQRAIFEMNRTGIGVDRDKLHEFELVAMERINEIEESLPINLKSPKQVGEWLFGELGYEAKILTATGKPSTSKQALQDLAHESQEASLLLEHRTLTKEVSAYYRPLIVASGPGTTGIGTVNPHFSSTRTVTGRLSCSDPNLQTIPRADVMGGVRECFVPREGNELWAFDLSQAELRVIAGYCKEDAMIDALENGRDLHSETALSIFGPDFTPLQRRFAKNLNFGFPYGIGPHKFATYIHPVPTERHVREAAEILAGYRRTYPNIVRTMDKLDKIASKQGYLPLGWAGRRRHFRGPGYIVPGYTGLNAIVQGGIGEFMKDVMIHPALADQCRGYGSRLVLQIHDELVFEVLPGTVGSLKVCLDGIAEDLDPFYMKMIWDRKQWT